MCVINDFYKKKKIYPEATFNKAHVYFAKLEQTGKLKAIITQNIDSLHNAAGSKNVLQIHGTIKKERVDKLIELSKSLEKQYYLKKFLTLTYSSSRIDYVL